MTPHLWREWITFLRESGPWLWISTFIWYPQTLLWFSTGSCLYSPCLLYFWLTLSAFYIYSLSHLWKKVIFSTPTSTNCLLSSNYSAPNFLKARNQVTLYVRTVSEMGVVRSFENGLGDPMSGMFIFLACFLVSAVIQIV